MDKDLASILTKLDNLDSRVAALETKVDGTLTQEAFNIAMDEVFTIVSRRDSTQAPSVNK